jgi:MFS family permease
MSDVPQANLEAFVAESAAARPVPAHEALALAGLAEQEIYLSRHARRNYLLYMVIVLLSLGASPFGDMSVFVPTLAMHLHAPTWIVALPSVVDYSISFVPILLLGWLMGVRTSRTRVYAWSVAAMYLPILALAIVLLHGGSNQFLIVIFCASVIAYSLALGVTILPCWDLFARIFPDTKRSKIMGQAGAVGQAATLLTAGIAAWLISSHSPLAFPTNYAVAMLIFASNGFLCMIVILNLKEYKPVVANDVRSSFREYVRTLYRTVRANRSFAAILRVAPFAVVLASLTPVALAYAVQYRGFTGANDKAWFVASRPYFLIPALLFLGYLSHHIGPARVAGGLAALIFAAIPLAMLLSGPMQLVPLLMISTGAGSTFFFVLLAVMRSAEEMRMHHYLAIYYTVCVIPGLAPLGLAWLIDRTPNLAMGLIMIVASITAIGFLIMNQSAPVASAQLKEQSR